MLALKVATNARLEEHTSNEGVSGAPQSSLKKMAFTFNSKDSQAPALNTELSLPVTKSLVLGFLHLLLSGSSPITLTDSLGKREKLFHKELP